MRILWIKNRRRRYYEKIINGKNMAVCSRTVWMSDVIWNHIQLACVFLSTG